jgi:hypothetical protein
MTTRIRVKEVSHAFPSDGTMLSCQTARLAVLYEDLRIEVHGTSADSIPVLDVTSASYRSVYFLRRSIASLVEVAEAVRLLDREPEFGVIKKSLDPIARRLWDRAVRFFGKRERFLEAVRNDIGGHFGQQAAEWAVKNVDTSAMGKIEVSEKTIHLDFAGEIASAAMFRHLSGSTADVKLMNLLRIVRVGFRHTAHAAHCLAFTYLWNRFG